MLMPVTTLNPSDKHASLSLSNGNLTFSSGTGIVAVRSTTFKTTGKRYFEAKFDANSGFGIGIYLASSSITLENGTAQTVGGSPSDFSSAGYSVGDVIGLAVDFSQQTIRMYKNGNLLSITKGFSKLSQYYAYCAVHVATGTVSFNRCLYTPQGFLDWDAIPKIVDRKSLITLPSTSRL